MIPDRQSGPTPRKEKKTVGRSASCVRNTKRNKAQCSYKSDIDKVCVQSLEWTAHCPFE